MELRSRELPSLFQSPGTNSDDSDETQIPCGQPVHDDLATSSPHREDQATQYYDPNQSHQPLRHSARAPQRETPPRIAPPELPGLRAPWRESPERQDPFHNRDMAPDRLYDPYNYRQPNYRYWQPLEPQRNQDEPRPSFPTFSGKSGEWDAFWLKFQLLADRYRWAGQKLVEQLLLSLKDEALTFAASLSRDAHQDPVTLIRALRERFSHNAPVETHRANLSHIRKNSRENLQEYASKVRSLMAKAYPDICNTQTYEQLLIQHFLNGLPDQSLIYEILIRKPQTLNEAVNLVSWHECCKEATRKRSNLRHLQADPATDMGSFQSEDSDGEDEGDSDLRRLNNRRFVTEERLQQFMRDLKRNLGLSLSKEEKEDDSRQRQNFRDTKKIVCFHCGEIGHIAPKCPSKSKPEEEKKLSENDNGLNLMVENQPRH